MVKNPPAMRETWVRSLGWEDPLEKEMATHSSILAWRTPGQTAEDEMAGWHRKKGKIHPTEHRILRLAGRDKKAFLSEQCKEIEEIQKGKD